MKRIVLFVLLGFFLMPVYAEHEKEVRVKKIRGECTITTDMDISPKAAALNALNDAKKKAVEKVSSGKVNAWEMVASGAEGESFNSVNMVQVDGTIVDYEVIEEGHEENPVRKKEITFYCVINATVKKGIDPDPDFTVSIKGIKNSYMVDDQGMSFTVLSSKDAYLKIFIFENESVGTRLYPSSSEPSTPIKANQEYKFPMKHNTYYELYTDKDIETDIMVFVLTKSECPFLNEETNRQEIESWMAKIPNDKKFVYYKSINIVNK